MSVFDSRINRRTLGGVMLGTAAVASASRFVFAQDATPEAEEVVPATLADLETVTQIGIDASNYGFGIRGGNENQPGWYVFTVSNKSDSLASFNLAKLPEEMSVSDFNSAIYKTINGVEVADLAEVTFAGGTTVEVGGSNSVLVNLSAGTWVIFSSHVAATQGSATIAVLGADEITAMGSEPIATPEGGEIAPEGFSSRFTVSVTETSVAADAAPGAGLNTVGVRNSGDSPVNLVVLNTTETVDAAAATDLAKSWIAGEETSATIAGGMGLLSPSAYGYIELDVTGGTYVAFSTWANADGTLQVDGGAIIVVPTF
ncbi:MAG: hypothetical protein M9934_02795 [Thermomicrobiales bacterium]|nr:hypothetical protein [Thermomicrobiales bacterium]MCO5218085.1 hypothetical protein [Thermomicrobiales bacterium]MCO5227201.1 hypothetical protein [Thermomicrobiales bacterium]